MVVLFTGRFDHFFDNVGRGGQVGVAHAHVDDVFAGSPAFHFQFVDSGENIGRQPIQSCKSRHLTPLGSLPDIRSRSDTARHGTTRIRYVGKRHVAGFGDISVMSQ